MIGTLYLVATPIGNLGDVTRRALDTLRDVDLIACEDTRHTRNLLSHFRISNRTISYHEHNEQERAEQLADRLLAGESIAIVSDAGTPGICDPGFRIVQRAIEIGATVVPIPGAVAYVNAMIASGFSLDSVFFGGFLPSKKGERRKRLTDLSAIPATLVFYEAPHRITKSLGDCAEVLGDRRAVVARELTKLHEEFVRGILTDLAARLGSEKVRGEIVLVIERGRPVDVVMPQTSLPNRVAELERQGIDRKQALKQAAREFGVPKSEAYRTLESSKD